MRFFFLYWTISSYQLTATAIKNMTPDSKVHVANMGPIWDRQASGGPHVGPLNLTIWNVHVEKETHAAIIVLNAKDTISLIENNL